MRSPRNIPMIAAIQASPQCGKILHLRTVSGKGGGPEKTILNSPRFLAGNYELHLAFIRPQDDPAYDIPERARLLDVDLVDVPERGALDPRTLWRLAQEVRDFRPDILHAHDYKTNVLGVLLGRCFRIPVMTTMHGYVARGGRLEAYYALDRWSLRHMNHVVAVSEDLYQMLLDLKLPATRRSLIRNGIDTEQFRRRWSIAEARGRLNLGGPRFLVGAVGRLAPEKGFDLLIRAIAQLRASGLDVGLVITGDGDERGRLQAIIDESKLQSCVRLLGHQRDVRDLYQAVDVFALSSLREGLPNVLLEAMALETPPLATRIAGIPHLITHGRDGWLIEPGSVDELVAGLRILLEDAGLRQRLGAEARVTVESRFSFAERMRHIRMVYDRILYGRPDNCKS